MPIIKVAQLEAVVKRINKLTQSPETSWRREGEKTIANVGNFHLEFAYGKQRLARMTGENGGMTDILGIGYMSKRELLNALFAFISGLEFNKNQTV